MKTSLNQKDIKKASENVCDKDIRKWFQNIPEMLKEEKKIRKLTGSRVFNAKETNFKLCPEKSRVFAKIGTKDVMKLSKLTPNFP